MWIDDKPRPDNDTDKQALRVTTDEADSNTEKTGLLVGAIPRTVWKLRINNRTKSEDDGNRSRGIGLRSPARASGRQTAMRGREHRRSRRPVALSRFNSCRAGGLAPGGGSVAVGPFVPGILVPRFVQDDAEDFGSLRQKTFGGVDLGSGATSCLGHDQGAVGLG